MISSKNSKSIFFIFTILLFFNILAWVAVFDLSRPNFLTVDFFDIGQGDAIFIETPSGHQILIDGGPTPAILEKLGKEMPFWDKTIDLVISTHPDHDHWGGLMNVLKQYKVENVLWTGIVEETAEYDEWIKLVENKRTVTRIAQAGQKVKAGKVEIDVLYPIENLEGLKFRNKNDTSIVNRLIFGKNSFLFTGDAAKSAEKKLIKYCDIGNCNLKSDILKVGHHGSKTSTSEEFLAKILPRVAVIQVGEDNRYGHPTQEALSRLEKFGINVLRTDKNSDIKIISDGNNFKIQNEK